MLDFIYHTTLKCILISDHGSKDAYPKMKRVNIAITAMLIDIA